MKHNYRCLKLKKHNSQQQWKLCFRASQKIPI